MSDRKYLDRFEKMHECVQAVDDACETLRKLLTSVLTGSNYGWALSPIASHVIQCQRILAAWEFRCPVDKEIDNSEAKEIIAHIGEKMQSALNEVATTDRLMELRDAIAPFSVAQSELRRRKETDDYVKRMSMMKFFCDKTVARAMLIRIAIDGGETSEGTDSLQGILKEADLLCELKKCEGGPTKTQRQILETLIAQDGEATLADIELATGSQDGFSDPNRSLRGYAERISELASDKGFNFELKPNEGGLAIISKK